VSLRRSHRSAVSGLTVGALTVGALLVTASPAPAAAPDAVPACDVPAVPIGSVQGSTDTSPAAGQVVTVAGTVVADLQGGGLGGFAVQDAGDGQPATSDGVFVFDPDAPDVALGDRAVVRGTATEFHGLTEITDVSLAVCGGSELPPPAALDLPATDAEREPLESMLVAPADELTVTDVFDLSRFGEVVLAQGGRLLSPTEAAEPGDPARAVAADNTARSIALDDGRTTNLSAAGEAPPFLTPDDAVRVGDTAELDQPMVLSYGFGAWTLQPSDGTAEGTTFRDTNPRPTAPPEVGGDLRIADFNVLNYFVDLPGQFPSARGASTAAELAQQQAKIVAAITALDADVLTLHEIENSAVLTPATPYRAVETLLAAVEAADGHDWDHVRASEDTDVITNAIVYRTDAVTAVGDPRIPTDAQLTAFANARTPIAQTFRAADEVFTVIADHLKSKGSGTGANADTGDGQGASNADRVAQATVVVDFAASVAAAAGDPDVLLTGDFNSYRHEDPVDVVTAAGYTDLAPVLAPQQYSYVFDGGSGSLDHVFASPSLVGKLTGLGIWDVNAVESSAYEYDGYEPFYAPTPYRASDHNPTVVGLATRAPEAPASASMSDPRPLRGDRVTVTGTGFTPGEEVTASLPSRTRGELGTGAADATGTVSITVTVPPALPSGDQEVRLTGTSGESASTGFELRTVLEEAIARLVRWWHGG
jgi:5'-nucleotidase